MTTALLVSKLVLAAVFLVAGISKLLDRRGFTSVLKDTGVPSHLAPVGALFLPLIEVLIAVGLMVPATSNYSVVAGLIFLCVFVVAILLNLVRGRRLACNCLGQVLDVL